MNHKETRMEKIDTDYKRRTWKIYAKLFKMHKPSRNSLTDDDAVAYFWSWLIFNLWFRYSIFVFFCFSLIFFSNYP